MFDGELLKDLSCFGTKGFFSFSFSRRHRSFVWKSLSNLQWKKTAFLLHREKERNSTKVVLCFVFFFKFHRRELSFFLPENWKYFSSESFFRAQTNLRLKIDRVKNIGWVFLLSSVLCEKNRNLHFVFIPSLVSSCVLCVQTKFFPFVVPNSFFRFRFLVKNEKKQKLLRVDT